MLNLFKYGLFSFPAAISLLIMQIYIPSFIAEMGIFSLTTIGIIFFAARLIDMVSDLLVGYASDKTPPEYGRRRIWILIGTPIFLLIRSEERRVGKECRCRWLTCHVKKRK